MLHAAAILGEGEKVTAATRLVIGSFNRKTRIMATQKSTNTTVADKEHIARSISSQDMFDLADNAQLGIGGSLPASNADVGLREKPICDCLKLVWEQEARGRSVVLVHRLTHLYVNVQLFGINFGCLNRLPLTTADDLRCT
jgi:hypothetical protein